MKNESTEEVLDGLIPFDIAGGAPIETFEEQDEILDTEEDIVEEAAEETNEEIETEEVEETELSEQDEQAQAAFLLFKEFGVLSDEDIPETQNLDTFKETLAGYEEKVTSKVIKSTSQDVQDVIEFGLTRKNATRKELIEYLQETTSDELPEISTVEEAESFLKAELGKDKKFKNASVLQTYLDSLEDDEKLDTAKEILADKEAVLAKSRQEKLAQEKAAQEAARKAQEEYLASLDKEITESGWDKPVQKRVKETLSNLQTLNQAITSNPKVFAQYLNFLSTFDSTKGEFDTSKFVIRAGSKAAKDTKTNIQADAVSSALTKFTKTKPNTASGSRDGLRPI